MSKAVVRSEHDLRVWVSRVAPEVEASNKPWTVDIKRFHRPRTTDQNSKLHAMIAELAEHCGYTPAEVKDYLKAEHGFMKVIEINGKERTVPMGTSEMNVQQLSYLIEELYRVGAEAGCQYAAD